MIITCPKCKSTFNVDIKTAKESFSQFKCSVCENVWEIESQNNIDCSDYKKYSFYPYTYILVLNLIIILTVILTLVLFKEKFIYLDNYWREFYNFIYELIPI